MKGHEEDGEEPKKRRAFHQPRVTARRLVAAIGLGLIAKGYHMMSVAPDATPQEAVDGGIFGVLVVIAGAGLAVFAVLFRS